VKKVSGQPADEKIRNNACILFEKRQDDIIFFVFYLGFGLKMCHFPVKIMLTSISHVLICMAVVCVCVFLDF
jgi:hypothetical protein